MADANHTHVPPRRREVVVGDKCYTVHVSRETGMAVKVETSFYGYRGRLTTRKVKPGGAAWLKAVAAAGVPTVPVADLEVRKRCAHDFSDGACVICGQNQEVFNHLVARGDWKAEALYAHPPCQAFSPRGSE